MIKNKALYLLLTAAVILTSCGGGTESKKENIKSNEEITDIPEPKFLKEGELSFLAKDGKEIKKIAIEIADDEQQQTQGLMYRKSMADEQGMLFIFPDSDIRNFWMHNTFISLDIIYANEKNEIVKICKNAEPLNENQNLGSDKNAKYVIEVNGGFSDKYGIAEGDRISFKR
ncbi:DUF192 domain-containing protein [Solitalea sp. MAHUQ-68]|uniref:DUF192 domain-containing protein n=1 Tax=Solitalea agri TaxID=2953739 RepID=A0A9X2JDC5_9SPHI|nr:DUF192 domain-containing protein [Solitalea agri]MCO4292765.1 DUF192 domain-containing protein [Solitalea agri]